jgi:hypothetical protein
MGFFGQNNDGGGSGSYLIVEFMCIFLRKLTFGELTDIL